MFIQFSLSIGKLQLSAFTMGTRNVYAKGKTFRVCKSLLGKGRTVYFPLPRKREFRIELCINSYRVPNQLRIRRG